MERCSMPRTTFYMGYRGRKGEVAPDSNLGKKYPQMKKKRKTQVRLAQRAYRSRKEATLSTLKGRVDQLETIVEKINKTFLGFTDDLMELGVLTNRPDLAQHLYHTIQQTLTLTHRAISVADDEAINVDTADTDAYVSEAGADAEVPGNTAGNSENSVITTPDAADSQFPRSILLSHPMAQMFDDWASLEPTDHPMTQIGTDVVPNPATTLLADTLFLNVSKPDTTGFAQRLYRACIEQGYQCLKDPSSKPEDLSYTFRLSLKVLPARNLITYFEDFLKLGHHPPAWRWNVPFLSIGGAGTHFNHEQRSYVVGETSSIVRIETEQIDADLRGDWFDCYDVEGYLGENMVKLIRGLAANSRVSASLPHPALDDEPQYQQLFGQASFEQPKRPTFVDEGILIECDPACVSVELQAFHEPPSNTLLCSMGGTMRMGFYELGLISGREVIRKEWDNDNLGIADARDEYAWEYKLSGRDFSNGS
ncbi:hypothetical protein ASPBRDRAFT_191303 [Aspergillus brasiliensis CBS 101740]|uniref:BZIP domain-containing protein n=1 Tax=Aspergillus brasiliensis (strain CBS 101740 / IMI 381727 / IBT 21946) TaxID=767769 RepID=A0A1L9V2J2_ASPBC|nr:hypothetical protein ASPBRDRAFT_191303 [Aspergillus brasiliensis CBS 101740]